jgi:hypothetical protein
MKRGGTKSHVPVPLTIEILTFTNAFYFRERKPGSGGIRPGGGGGGYRVHLSSPAAAASQLPPSPSANYGLSTRIAAASNIAVLAPYNPIIASSCSNAM